MSMKKITTIRLPQDLHEQLKEKAQLEGSTFTALIIRILKEGLTSKKSNISNSRTRQSPFYNPLSMSNRSHRMISVDALIDLLDSLE